VALTDGQIKLANATRCIFKGGFMLGREGFTVEHMTLAADKLTATGVGASPPTNADFAAMG
jgi:hypothetical protein